MINGNCVETTNQMMMMLMMMMIIIIIITIIIIYYDILLSPWWWWYTNCVITIGMIIIPAGIFRADWVEGKISTFGPPPLARFGGEERGFLSQLSLKKSVEIVMMLEVVKVMTRMMMITILLIVIWQWTST